MNKTSRVAFEKKRVGDESGDIWSKTRFVAWEKT